MNLLIEGIDNKSVIPANTNKKVTIDNISTDYPVHRIRLDELYYNDQNDRIVTWMAQYKEDSKIENLKNLSAFEYNDIIHKLVTDSNKEAIKKTQMNINMVGQQEPGVVLSDGRIIDGNRRFTCLRNIEKETGKIQYFEAVILDHNIERNAKQIKMLELMLQHGVDEKVDYNPIDRLVGLYIDIVERKLLTLKEYADSINMTEKDLSIEVERAKLMIDFLEFINAPKQYHIARHFNINDPLKELNKMLKKINDEDKKEDLKNAVFAQFLVQPEGDATRYIRKIQKISTNARFLDEYLEEQIEYVEKVCDEIERFPNVTSKEINIIRADEKIKNDFLHSTEKYVNKVDGDATRNQPVKQAGKAYDSLDLIDLKILHKLSAEQQEDVFEKLEMIETIILKIKSELDV